MVVLLHVLHCSNDQNTHNYYSVNALNVIFLFLFWIGLNTLPFSSLGKSWGGGGEGGGGGWEINTFI